MRVKVYKNDTFLFRLVIVDQPKDINELNKYLHRRGMLDKNDALPKSAGSAPSASVYRLDNCSTIVVFWDKKLSYGTIAHEAVHVATGVCDDRGVSTEHRDDEPLAYLTEWAMHQFIRFFNIKDTFRK